jgi:hypothetical protein
MVLTVEQRLQITMVYEKAAADNMSVPPQQRAAFARKAKWFRTLARIGAKKEAVTAAGRPAKLLDEPHPEAVSQERGRTDEGWTPKAKYQALAERLKTARAAEGVTCFSGAQKAGTESG